MKTESCNPMPDTHVPLDEEVEKRFDDIFSLKSRFPDFPLISTYDYSDTCKEIKQFIAQELAHLKHTICAEIEELRETYIHNDEVQTPVDSSHLGYYNQAIDDALSVKSLKES